CPHCSQGGGQQETVAVVRTAAEDSVTKPLTASINADKPTLSSEISAIQSSQSVAASSAADDSKTISYSQAKLGTAVGSEPVVGWLVCTEGPHRGEDFRLKAGRNFIGRANNMDAALTKDKSVSREKHAIVVYEPKAHIFLIQPGESRELCYINDSIVLSAQELKRNDVISVGDSKLMFFPCCDEVFNWEKTEKTDEE
ncbi:MAG: FHA domain-containing protein, partial [Clostridia bacterium]|nr:FHA domain-containing protein [Clostridia bacterium]